MIGPRPTSCMLGWMTELLFCIYVKVFLPPVLNSVGFSSSLSCMVQHIERADKIVIKDLGSFVDGKFQGYSFCPPKKYKPKIQALWCTTSLHGIVWNSGHFDYSELANILPRAFKSEYFAKSTEKCDFIRQSVRKFGRSWLC